MKIKDFSEILNGYAFKSSQYINNGYRIIRITNVQSGYLEDKTPVFYEYSNNLNKYELKENDVLISLTGNVGRCALVTREFLPAYLNQRVCCLRVNKKKVLPKFLYYILNSQRFELECINSSKGIAQLNMSTEWLKEYNLEIPSIECQKKIIGIFDKLYATINIKKNQLNKFEELIKSQFFEMFGDPFNNINNYEFVTFVNLMERCVDIGSNGSNKTVVEHLDMKNTEDYALLVRTLNFTSNDFKKNVKYISKDAYEFFNKSKVFGGEIIFNKIGSAGINFLMPDLKRPVSLGLNQIMVTPKGINTRYLYDFLNTEYGKFQINSRVNGAVTKSIKKTELKKIPIMYPPMELQKKYADFAKQIDKKKFEFEKNLEKLEEIRSALMQEYFG